MMRILPVLVLSTLALSTVGCAEEDDAAGWRRKNVARHEGDAPETDESKTATAGSAITVNGTVDAAGADHIEVSSMDANGKLSPVGTAPVKDGKFSTEIPAGTSPTGVFIIKALGVGGAVLNSGLVNGLPAFIKGFVVDAPLDAVTSFKTEILMTIAKGGTPGVQNYINVLDAYVDANLAGVIAVDSVLTNDVIEVVGATADAVIAAEEVIEDALRKAGLPVNFDALEQAQASTVSGFQGFLLDFSNKRISTAKNLVAGFEHTLADLAKPVDDAIFNAVVNGGGAFGSKMKEKAPQKGFVASKSAFRLTSALSAEKMNDAATGTSLEGKVKDAANAFVSAVSRAQSGGDLDAAKNGFMATVVGNDAAGVFAPLKGLLDGLTQAMQAFDPAKVAEMLGQLDLADFQLPADLQNALGADKIAPMTNALRLVQKQVAQ